MTKVAMLLLISLFFILIFCIFVAFLIFSNKKNQDKKRDYHSEQEPYRPYYYEPRKPIKKGDPPFKKEKLSSKK